MKQPPNEIESLIVSNDFSSVPDEVKEYTRNLFIGNVNSLKKNALCNWYFEHPDFALGVILKLLIDNNKLNYKQKSFFLYSENSAYSEDVFLKLTNRPEEVLMLENDMMTARVIHDDCSYFKNKRLENLKCLHGVFLVLEEYGYFKRVVSDQSSNHRIITHRQTLRAFNKRYHIKRIRNISEEEKRECIEKALNRLPILKKLLKKSTYLN
jgi:hypothetical protein